MLLASWSWVYNGATNGLFMGWLLLRRLEGTHGQKNKRITAFLLPLLAGRCFSFIVLVRVERSQRYILCRADARRHSVWVWLHAHLHSNAQLSHQRPRELLCQRQRGL